jgi:hypothetical protein
MSFLPNYSGSQVLVELFHPILFVAILNPEKIIVFDAAKDNLII